MGFSFPLSLLLITTTTSFLFIVTDQHPLLLLDHLMRDCAFRCYSNHSKTAFLYTIPLPHNITGIRAHTVRYRSGSLRRYGAQIQQFRLPPGADVRPYVERLIVVHQHWGNWSSFYYNTTKLSPHYHLLSPVLGILAYNGGISTNTSTPINIFMQEKPMTIHFSSFIRPSSNPGRLLCAFFAIDGKVRVYNESAAGVCVGFGQGRYALVIKAIPRRDKGIGRNAKMGKWKIVVESLVGGVLVAVLLGLLCVALVQMKKKSKIAEMERRAYEEEALQVSMVGHFRAPTAAGTRTLPSLEDDYAP